MSSLIIILLSLCIIFLCWRNFRLAQTQETRINEMKRQLQQLGSDLQPQLFDNIDPADFTPEMQLTVRVKDPIALAKREDKMARLFADLLPALIIQKVYEQVRDEVRKGLNDNQVEADVDIEVIALSSSQAE